MALAYAPAHTSTNTALPLSFRRLARTFSTRTETRRVLQDVNLEIAAGELVAILGPSGCGKSTLLRAASGLDTPSFGQVLIGDLPVAGIDERCSVVFQEPRLLPWRSIRENIELGLPLGLDQSEGNALIDELLEITGLEQVADVHPREISDGLAQRVSLARALARRPGVLLLDEPFGTLDALTRLELQELLRAVRAAIPTTVLLVTHDVDETLQLADRVIVLGREAPGIPASVIRDLRLDTAAAHQRRDGDFGAHRSMLQDLLSVDNHTD
ncbi:ABC transporter ATP-binding protein [Glutamicibacter sp. PS]|uniref:ABC transporter ATP-binding protein n=1 Tax=Glutamicibacter sp. PS TaxID=3075634 RepID=UPI00284454C6|nr:ABC transporter ATP-binding protein [Glutamicibacter sp. PS]MDR4534046.1 ABC transporter ATP-binding protein [Glutamicibacter sp. PS]